MTAREDVEALAEALANGIHDSWCDGVCDGVWNPQTNRFDGCGEDALYDRLDDVGAQAEVILASDWLAARDERIRADERKRLAGEAGTP